MSCGGRGGPSHGFPHPLSPLKGELTAQAHRLYVRRHNVCNVLKDSSENDEDGNRDCSGRGHFSCSNTSLRETPHFSRVSGRPCCVVSGRKEPLLRQVEVRAVGWDGDSTYLTSPRAGGHKR